MKRKYPKTRGWYVYKHVFPNDMYYPGMSSQQPNRRWHPSHYNTTSARLYIEYFGWENVEHVIIADGLTKEEAKKLEDQLIEEGKRDGLCINSYRSGGEDAEKERKRKRKRYQTEEYKEHQREYQRNRYQNDPEYKEQQREYKRNRYQNDPEFREKIKESQREYRERPENREKQREYMRQYRLKKKLNKNQ